MSRVLLPWQYAPLGSTAGVTFTTMAGSGMSMVNDGRVCIMARLSAPFGTSLLIRGAPDYLGREQNLSYPGPTTGKIIVVAGPFSFDAFDQTTDFRLIHIDGAGESGGLIEVAAIHPLGAVT